VLYGDTAPPEKRAHTHTVFGPCLLWPNGRMHEDSTWYGDRLRALGSDHSVLDGTQLLLAKGAQQPPLRPICLLWSRSPISATAELLYIKTFGGVNYTGNSLLSYVMMMLICALFTYWSSCYTHQQAYNNTPYSQFHINNATKYIYLLAM